MQRDRGRGTHAPWRISARGWADILRRAWKETGKKNLSLVGGGVAYFVLLAVFPTLAALVSVYGLVANPGDVAKIVQSLSGILPPSTAKLIGDELRQLVSASGRNLGLGAVIGIVIALWSASRGMGGMMTALDIAYGQAERRGLIRFNVTALLLAVMLSTGGLVALALIIGLPAALNGMDAHGPARWISLLVEWPLLIVFAMGMLALIYRYGPDQDNPKWKWASSGVIVATILWVVGSILLAIYVYHFVYHFGDYNRTYGSLGALGVLLTWMWLSAFVVLFGAEINGASRRQMQRDTAAGAPLPMRAPEAKDPDAAQKPASSANDRL